MPRYRAVLAALLLCALMGPALIALQSRGSNLSASEQARRVQMAAIVIDGHADTPQRMLLGKDFDLAARHSDGHVDIPRMTEGGLDAEFFSIYVPSSVTGPPAVKRALDLIDTVRETARARPDQMVLATSATDIRRASAEHKIAALMGMEGGHMIDDDLRILRNYAALGVRYLTIHTPWLVLTYQRPNGSS